MFKRIRTLASYLIVIESESLSSDIYANHFIWSSIVRQSVVRNEKNVLWDDLTLSQVHLWCTDSAGPYLGNEIDHFLMTRNWYVSKEPYAWHEHTHSSNVIIIDRVQHGIEKPMLFWSLHQYPPQHVCESTPLLLGTLDMSHPGWGSVSEMYHLAQRDLKQGITVIYVSHKNDPLDNTGFITGSDCPHTLNKWECAFMAPTNCSIPAILTNCSVHECVQQVVPSTFYFSLVFDSGTLNACLLYTSDAADE